jgi:hypothetical protein
MLQLNLVELFLEKNSGDQSSGELEPFSALTRWGLKKAKTQLNREPLHRPVPNFVSEFAGASVRSGSPGQNGRTYAGHLVVVNLMDLVEARRPQESREMLDRARRGEALDGERRTGRVFETKRDEHEIERQQTEVFPEPLRRLDARFGEAQVRCDGVSNEAAEGVFHECSRLLACRGCPLETDGFRTCEGANVQVDRTIPGTPI